MVNEDEGNLKSSVFFIWGGLCTAAFVWSYLFIPETKVCLFSSGQGFCLTVYAGSLARAS
jgi:hypothetical protein